MIMQKISFVESLTNEDVTCGRLRLLYCSVGHFQFIRGSLTTIMA